MENINVLINKARLEKRIEEMAKEIGCSQETLSRILNKKQGCSKTLAYAITKLINPDFEISTLFEIK